MELLIIFRIFVNIIVKVKMEDNKFDNKFFEYKEKKEINKITAQEFDRIFSDLYKELKIEPILKNKNE